MDKLIRNVGIVAHVDGGKTTVAEHMLFLSGEVRAAGRVDDGTAHTDYLEVERTRGISVRAASTTFTWKDVQINLIDTPGHADFSGEVERTLRVLDGAVLVISAVEGIQAQTELLWKALRALKIPTLLFINKLDRAGAGSQRVFEEIQASFSTNLVSMQNVYNEESADCVVQDVSAFTEKEIELLAEFDDEILTSYLNGQSLTQGRLLETLACGVKGDYIYPVFYGCAIKGIGISELMDAIVRYLPAPRGESESPLSGLVFRIEHDKVMGRVAHIRLYGGKLQNRDVVANSTTGADEKVTQIRKVYGQKYKDTGVLHAGDIAAVCGLSGAKIGDIIGSGEGVPRGYKMAVPLLVVQVFAGSDAEYQPLVAALSELSAEDPLLDFRWSKEQRQLNINIMGAIQLEVYASLLKERYGLSITFGPPAVIYKETPSQAGYGYVRYTMPKPCWAVMRFLIEPAPRGAGVHYSSQVRDEHILTRYQHQVENTIPEALRQGLYGWEVTDLNITLVEGEHHVMHTHPLDFIVATPMGIMDGLQKTGTTLLEPILSFRISVPEEYGGKVIGDIVKMQGSFDNPVISKGSFTVEGLMPVATSLEYPVRLGAITGGRGNITTGFYGYAECPGERRVSTPRIGVDPLDRAKYILNVRNAL